MLRAVVASGYSSDVLFLGHRFELTYTLCFSWRIFFNTKVNNKVMRKPASPKTKHSKTCDPIAGPHAGLLLLSY